MTCKFFILGIKDKDMNNRVFIPSNGIGEIYLDLSDMCWYSYESSTINIDKEIPFLKLLLDMASLRMRYYINITLDERIGIPQIILDIGRHSAKLIRSLIRIKNLSKDMFCTGDIVIVDNCMGIYRQFLNREPFDFFIVGIWEIREALDKIHQELKIFQENSEQLFRLFYNLLPKNSKFWENLDDTEEMFNGDLKKQFAKFIITDGLYSSGIFTNIEGVFF